MKAPRRFSIAILLPCLLAACRREAGVAGVRSRAAGAPIIVVSIDTLRADHLPAYGYRRVDTPAIERLRHDGILFEEAWSQCPLTLPSHVSIFTGLLPPIHGVRNNIGYRLDAAAHATLARLLKQRGYATGASVSAWVLRASTGLADSFDFYDDAIEPPSKSIAASQVQRPGSETMSRAISWADGVRGRPFFLFVHLYEPHAPYEPPEPFRTRYALPYDGEIAAADSCLGVLLQWLDRNRLYDPALIILLSDHGEGLMDHGEQEHGILLYREDLRVPLILKLPGALRRGKRVAEPVALTDVLPTIAAFAGAVAPAVSGHDLLVETPNFAGAIYSETFYPRIHLGWSDLRSLADGHRHFIDGPAPELYDLGADPAERTNLYLTEEETARQMKRDLNRVPADFRGPVPADAEQLRKLAALGYLSMTSPSSAGPALPNPRDQLPELAEIKHGFRLASEGDRRGAIEIFQALLAKNPNLFDVQYKLALTLEESGRLREAEDGFRAAIRSSPSMATEAALPLARVSLALGELDQAKANAEVALHDAPADSAQILARVALSRGNLDEAESRALSMRGTPTVEAKRAVLLG